MSFIDEEVLTENDNANSVAAKSKEKEHQNIIVHKQIWLNPEVEESPALEQLYISESEVIQAPVK